MCVHIYLFTIATQPPLLYQPLSPPTRQPRPPPYLSSPEEHRGTTPLRSDPSSYEDEDPRRNPFQYRDVVGQNLPEERHLQYNNRDTYHETSSKLK